MNTKQALLSFFNMAYYRRRYYRRNRRYYGKRGYRRSSFYRKKSRQLRQADKNRIIVSSQPIYTKLPLDKNYGPGGEDQGKYSKVIFLNPLLHLIGFNCTDDSSETIAKLPAFDSFSKMFDEFKINAMRVKVQMVTLPSANSNNASIIRSAIDKNGIAPEFDSATDEKKSQIMQSYSSFTSKIINNSELYSIYRTFYPFGPFQKGRYLGCSVTREGKKVEKNIREDDWTYKPIAMIQFYSSDTTTNPAQVTCNITYDFDITFKGQRNLTS